MSRRGHRRVLVLAFACALAATPAQARVFRSESLLPPGQSGFVAPTGVTTGTGSPHLTDQQQPFVDFARKPALFDQPGTTESPRPGVTITRDRFGVPDVRAGSSQGAWWGAGYAVAQDRLFELELFRRATAGRLAEILGRGYLDSDVIARRDYYTPGELDTMFNALPAELRARMDAYRDGINAWIAHVRVTPADMPGEFPALNVPLVDWQTRDSAAIGVFLARTVPSGDGQELRNLQALRTLGARTFKALLPLRVRGQISTVPRRNGLFASQPGRTRRQERRAFTRSRAFATSLPLPAQDVLASEQRAQQRAAGMLGHVGGSYMFAVRRLSDHHAILFNGPQLGFSIPELFVELEVHAPGLDVRGATAPGVPVIGLGQNGYVAWGLTSGLSDDDDLYAEQAVPGQPESYRFNGQVRQMSCREETFGYQSPPTDLLPILSGKVPPAPDSGSITKRLCRTVHGPVQSHAGDVAYARRYAIWGRELDTLVGIAALNDAHSIGDVDRALSKVTWNENVVAVDSGGNIGYWHPGLLPLKPTGFDERLPYPGTGEAEWRGFLPVARRPHVINPRQGWLSSWNNVPSQGWTTGDGPATERLGGPFHRDAFLASLVRGLARAPTFEGAQGVVHTAGTTAQQRPLATARLRAAARGARGNAATVLNALLAWDGSYARQAPDGTVDPGVAIWQQFKSRARDVALGPFGPAADLLGGSVSTSHMFDAANGDAYALRTLGPRGYRRAAEATFSELTQRFGTSDPARWREPRRLYKISAQGAAGAPKFPFFDRGTFEQVIETGP